MSDRDNGLQAADNEIARAAREICVDNLSRSIQKKFGVLSRVTLNSSTHFAFTEMSSGLYICFAHYLFCPLFALLSIYFALHCLLSICFALTETRLQAGFVELEETSPQALKYPRNSSLGLCATSRFPGKRVWAQHI